MRGMAVMMATMAMAMSGAGMPEYVQQGGLHIQGRRKERRKIVLPPSYIPVLQIPKGHETEQLILDYTKDNKRYSIVAAISWGTRKSRTKAIAKANAMFADAVINNSDEDLLKEIIEITSL